MSDPSSPRAPVVAMRSVGSYLPARVIVNTELESFLDTTDAWIRERTGIAQRYRASEEETVVMMGSQAAQAALSAAGLSADVVDCIIVASSSTAYRFPSAACLIQADLGISSRATAFDLQAACAGFVYALSVAESLIAAGRAHTALVIGVERMSDLLDWSDRSTCVLFGDGAGAVLLSALSPEEKAHAPIAGIEQAALAADGRYAAILTAGYQEPLKMQGSAVFKTMVPVLSRFIQESLQAWGLSLAEIDAIVPHQANQRILQAVAERLDYPLDKMVSTVAEHSNTSAASIPLALASAFQAAQLRVGDRVLLLGFGGGLTWGAILMRIPEHFSCLEKRG